MALRALHSVIIWPAHRGQLSQAGYTVSGRSCSERAAIAGWVYCIWPYLRTECSYGRQGILYLAVPAQRTAMAGMVYCNSSQIDLYAFSAIHGLQLIYIIDTVIDTINNDPNTVIDTINNDPNTVIDTINNDPNTVIDTINNDPNE